MYQNLLRICLLAISLAINTPVWAARPWVSIPSTPDITDKVVINGGNITPFSAVTVRITWPDGNNVDQNGAVDAEGKFTLDCLPTMIGGYSVTVLDQNGKKIGGGMFGYVK